MAGEQAQGLLMNGCLTLEGWSQTKINSDDFFLRGPQWLLACQELLINGRLLINGCQAKSSKGLLLNGRLVMVWVA